MNDETVEADKKRKRKPTPNASKQETPDPPTQTPAEVEAEERWVELQYRKHCPWSIRFMKFFGV